MRAIIYLLLVFFLFAFSGVSSIQKPIDQFEDLERVCDECAVCNSISDTCIKNNSNCQIELFDTTDCVFRIFSQHRNPKYIESYESRFRENPKEIPFHTIDKLSTDADDLRLESYSNKMIGVEYIKRYSEGQLRSCGFEISNGKVGKWKYYSATGKLDSIVEYNNKGDMTFCEFFEIARAFGMIGEHSKMPSRNKLFEVIDSLGLKNGTANNNKLNWIDYDFYPIPEEEENGRFSCDISFSNKIHQVRTVRKFFQIGNKSLCFCLTVSPRTREVIIYEYEIIQ